MIARGRNQPIEPEEFTDFQDEWDATPLYPEEYASNLSDDDSQEYISEEYIIDAYPTDDFLESDFLFYPLPKVLFACTIVACLILAGLLSLVTFHMSPATSQVNPELIPTSAQAELGSQPQAAATPPPDAAGAACTVHARYPASIRRWCGLITQYASQQGLPPDLVAALIWQEFGGNPVAYSSSGAVGLMQIMPSDGLAASFQCAAGPCFSNRPKIDALEKPRIQRFIWHTHACWSAEEDREPARSVEILWTDGCGLLLRR